MPASTDTKEKPMLTPLVPSVQTKPIRRRTEPAENVPHWAVTVTAIAALSVCVAALTVTTGHVDLLDRLPIFQGAKSIEGVTDFLNELKGYLISIVLAGFTVAGIAVGAAKLTGHSRANDMIFNVGVGVAIFAALPTLVA
jgi:hypothetical protein